MRHRVHGYKLTRSPAHRRALWRNLAIALFTHGQITTTLAKARGVQPFVEKLITTARKGDLAARRRLIRQLGGDPYLVVSDDDPDVVRNRYGELVKAPRVIGKLIGEIAPRYADRDGGYTRMVRLGKHRIGDAGELVVLQLVGDEQGPQVSGQFSRRRQKADKRMAFAAQLRKGEKGGAAQANEPSDLAQDDATATATAVAEAEPETDVVSDDAVQDEAQEPGSEQSSDASSDDASPEGDARKD